MKTKIQQKYDTFVAYFEEHMPIAETELEYKDPYQLLVAVILSAQCTDKRVNMTTPALFAAYPDAEAMAKATPEELYEYIRSISYPHNKSKHLAGMARKLVEDYGGEVPGDVDAPLADSARTLCVPGTQTPLRRMRHCEDMQTIP